MAYPALATLSGRRVRFRIRDIHLPEPATVLEELHGGDVLEGRVIQVSDSGGGGGAFVVVEVGELSEYCIVAAERILWAV